MTGGDAAAGDAVAPAAGVAPPDHPPGAAERRALVAVLVAVALASLDTAIANTALPTIAADLHAQPAASVWIVNAYQIAVVAALLPLAALGDLVGPRRIFLAGVAVFTVASLACACATSLPALAAARALQGLGAAGPMSVNIALIRLLFPAHRLGRGVGINAFVVGVAFAVGPTVASLVLAVAPWPWLFGINVPLGVMALAFALPALPRSTPRDHVFDPATAGLTALACATLIGAMTAAAQRAGASRVAALLVVGGVALFALLRRQRGHPAPMLPVDLLRRPLFALSALTAVASFATQGLAFVSLPFYFETVLHRNPVETGFLLSPWPIVVAIAAPIAGRMSDRYPPAVLGAVGLALLSAGMASMALLPPSPTVAGIVVRMMLCGVGFGLFQSPNLRALMSSAPPERSGGASGVIAIARLTGQTGGAALVALCLGLAGARGSTWALALGAGFAAVAAIASGARMWAK
ncbi:MAG: MFS transporter [Burkholderiales bacterium]|nr:MFS transporter [Burkholderiales bacterium]